MSALAPSPNRREAQRLATRARILDAAVALFAARGFEGTALPAIAERSDARVSLIVYHYGSKEALWRAAVDEVHARVLSHLATFEERLAAATGREFFRLAVRAHITAAARHPAYQRILFQEAMQPSDRLQWLVEAHQRPMTERILAVVRRAQAEGLLPGHLAPMHLKYLTGGLFTLPITLAPEYALLAGEDATSDDFIERHIDACLDLLDR